MYYSVFEDLMTDIRCNATTQMQYIFISGKHFMKTQIHKTVIYLCK